MKLKRKTLLHPLYIFGVLGYAIEIVLNELRRFKHSADFLANSSHIIESAAISASYVGVNPTNPLALRNL